MGGAIAQEVAIRHADRVDRLILFGTFCGGIWAEPASYSVFRRLLATDNQSPEEAARQAWPVTYSPEYLAANADAVEQQMRRELEHPTPTFVAQRQMEALRQFDSYRRSAENSRHHAGCDRHARRSGEAAKLRDPGVAHSQCAAGTVGRSRTSRDLGSPRGDCGSCRRFPHTANHLESRGASDRRERRSDAMTFPARFRVVWPVVHD